ncbi:hypothetical protein NSQ69_27260 [Bacillus sp. FSL R10-2201]|uniref:hypothetical protein n=1 Tax=Bacillus sp. FSL R10-2201 TaxID=2954657 RepID=UPI0030FA0B6F
MNNKPLDNNTRHPRTPIPFGNYINVQMWYSKNANTGGDEHTRITEHIKQAEAIFLSCEQTFTIRNVWAKCKGCSDPRYATLDTRLIAENIDVDNLPQDVFNVFDTIKIYFDEINVLVCFVEGSFFIKNGSPSNVVARAEPHGDNNYIILLSEEAEPLFLAHELGHVLNFSNSSGRANDPNPFPNDPDHNASSDNLMFPTPTDTNITPQQCNQFFDSNIIQQN